MRRGLFGLGADRARIEETLGGNGMKQNEMEFEGGLFFFF